MIGPYMCKIFAEAEIDLLKLNLLCKEMHQTYENNKDEYLKNLNLTDKHTLFLYACKSNKLGYVKRLLPYVNPSICENTAFRHAVYGDNIKLVKILLKSDRLKLGEYSARYANKEILELLIESGYLDEKSRYDIVIHVCKYGSIKHRMGKINILIDSLSQEYKVMIFNKMIKKSKFKVISYMITTYDINFDISYLNYSIVTGLACKGCDESFKAIFSEIPINMHDRIIKNMIANYEFPFMSDKKSEGCIKILAYVLKYGSIFNDINEYLYDTLVKYMDHKVKFILYIREFLQSDRLLFINRKVLKLSSKSSREIAELIFNSGKINYTDIDEEIIDLLIECGHTVIAKNLIDHEQVHIEKNYGSEIRKRKAVDEMTDKYIRSMELDIKVRMEKKQKY